MKNIFIPLLFVLTQVLTCGKNTDNFESQNRKNLNCGDGSIKKIDSIVTEKKIIEDKKDYVIKLFLDKEGNVLECNLVKSNGLTNYEIEQITDIVSELRFPCLYDLGKLQDGNLSSYENGMPAVLPITKKSIDRIRKSP